MYESDVNFLINAFFVLMILLPLSLGLVLYRYRRNTHTVNLAQYFSWYFATTTLFWFFLWLKVNMLLSMGYSAVVELYILASMFLLLAVLKSGFTSRMSKVIIIAHLLVCAVVVLLSNTIQIALLQSIFTLIVYPIMLFAGLRRVVNDNDSGHGLIGVAAVLVIVISALQLYGALEVVNFGRLYAAFMVLLSLPLTLGGIGLLVSLLDTGYQRLGEWVLKDPLTGLYTRRGMNHAIAIPLALLRRNEGYIGAIAVEITDYWQLRKRHGNAVGDRLLAEVAKVLKVNTRDSDIVSRLGDGKFMVILPGESVYTELVAERLKKAVENASFSHADADIFCTPNVGIASQFANKDFEYLLEVAEQSMPQLASGAGEVIG